MSALVGTVGILLLLFRRTRRRGKQLALAGFIACFGASGIAVYRDNVTASEAGFRSGEDMRAAQKEGVTDPEKWREIVRERSEVERAAAAKERQQREAEEKLQESLKAQAQFHPRYVAYEQATDPMHVRLMSSAMDEIRKRLRDPQSAQFRNVHLVTGSTDVTVTCGEVNAKNGFGGYGDYTGFISNGVSVSYLASDFKSPQDFLKTWTQLCQ
jgi:hypothetical protein